MLNNKRGSLPIIVFVMLMLILTISTLAIFANNTNKVEEKLGSFSLLEDLYVEESIVQYELFRKGSKLLDEGKLTRQNLVSEFENHAYLNGDIYLKALQNKILAGEFILAGDEFSLVDNITFFNADNRLSLEYVSKIEVDFKKY